MLPGWISSTIGSQDMRSRIRLPESIPTYSELLRKAGYYCTNNSKTDYNFPSPTTAWDESSRTAHWKNRPDRNQPFYHLLAECDECDYVAYVSQQNLLQDLDGGPIDHPSVPQLFEDFEGGRYRLRRSLSH